MNKQDSLEEELKSLSPWLQEQSRRPSGMQVPPDYFEGLESVIFHKIEAEQLQRPVHSARPGGMLRRMHPGVWASAAAVAVLAVACWWMLRPAPATALPEETYAETLTNEEIESYVLDNVNDFETDQLAIVTESEWTEQVTTSPAAAPVTKPAEFIPPAELENLLQQMSEEELESLL